MGVSFYNNQGSMIADFLLLWLFLSNSPTSGLNMLILLESQVELNTLLFLSNLAEHDQLSSRIPRIFFLVTSSAVTVRFFTFEYEYGIKDMQRAERRSSVFLGHRPCRKDCASDP